VSQYDNIVYYDFVHKAKDDLERRLKEFFVKLEPKLTGDYATCVVDTVIFSDKIMVVELNPFNNYDGAGTGGSLFRWSEPDRDVLEGKEPFQFRYELALLERIEANEMNGIQDTDKTS